MSAWCVRSTRTRSWNVPRSGVWVVADGLGGHRAGEVASRTVCDALVELVPDPSFEATVYAARHCLQAANEYLLRTGHARGDDRPQCQHGRRAADARHELRHSLGG